MKLAPGMIIVCASAMLAFDEKREEFANNMFQRMFADQSLDIPEELLVQRLNSGSYRVCDQDQSKSLTTQEAFSCSEAYFTSIGRQPIPIYKDINSGGLAGDLNADGEYTRKEWELVNHSLTWKITKAMLSIILDCDVSDIKNSTILKDDSRRFLRDQLQYYFQFPHKRYYTNIAETGLTDLNEWEAVQVAGLELIGRLYNDALRMNGVSQSSSSAQ
ncbi:unnamed protein product [Oikopleura dioica]|uniref:Uncharacterized protein n=1 Tax=Oikopleura dioica TaxID=34765 RepID=E4YA07_OIKDI|nr:unnamed protein product [Oikopleura dioica]